MKNNTVKVQEKTDLFIQFSDEQLQSLNLDVQPGDKFTVETFEDGSIALTPFANLEIDLGEFDRTTLEWLVTQSIDRDISVNEVITDVLERIVEEYNQIDFDDLDDLEGDAHSPYCDGDCCGGGGCLSDFQKEEV
jgi:ABC-type amino acid transport substrate-binding protein